MSDYMITNSVDEIKTTAGSVKVGGGYDEYDYFKAIWYVREPMKEKQKYMTLLIRP